MQPDWIDLDGTANTRDVGGLPTTDGRRTVSRRLLRSDNLQDLSAEDVRRLVDDYGVRTVADLRADIEVRAGGPGPMTREPLVAVEQLSLFPERSRRAPSPPTSRTSRRGSGDPSPAAGSPASTSGSWPSGPTPCWPRCA